MLAVSQSEDYEARRSHQHSPEIDYEFINYPTHDYTKETERLKSFANWPNREISPQTLTKAGFYYIGTEDIVRCAFCDVEGYKWVRSDNPMEDHYTWKPSCPFVRKVQRSSSSEEGGSSEGYDTCGSVEIFPKSVADDELLLKLGANKTKGPTHKEHCTYENRLASFGNWPKCMPQKPPELAEAGFFYRGTGDQTICFSCGGGLKDWEESADPWEEHAVCFPKCNYLIMKKGKDFVNLIARKQTLCPVENTEERPGPSSNAASAEDLMESDSEPSVSCTGSQDEDSESLSDNRLCKICFKNEMGVLFLPCRHIVACVDCATALSHCALCRVEVKATVRAFLS